MKGPSPVFLVGTLHKYGKGGFHEVDDTIMKQYGTLVGVYDSWKPALMIGDPDFIKEVTVTKFSSFCHSFKFWGHRIIKTTFLQQSGEEWRRQRSMASPAFTTSRLKQMLPMMSSCVDDLVRHLDNITGKNRTTLDFRHYSKLFTVDVISRAAFATQVSDIYRKGENDEFVVNVVEVVQPIIWKYFLAMFLPWSVLQLLDFSPFPANRMEYTIQMLSTILDRKKKKLTPNVGYPDFVGLFLSAEGEESMKDNEIIANLFLLLAAGFETTSSLITMTIYILSFEQDIQERLYREVQKLYDEKGKFDYDSLSSLEFMDAVINESLRYFPPVLRIDRVASEDATLSNGIFIPKGTHVRFPVYNIHHNEEYWPDNMEFKPERWLPENKDSINTYAFLPFVVGPKNCIGYRFALLEAKLVVANLLINFKFSRPTNDSSDYHKIESTAIVICPPHVYIDVECR